MVVSLVMTVLDEAGSFPALLDSILAQERRPDEVVIVDGGSSDRTVALAHDFAQRAAPDLPVRVEVLPGAISRPGAIAPSSWRKETSSS